MHEVRFHGRGGQGAVTAATLLSIAGFKDGKFTQAFPVFGVERRGAPVQAFTRISEDEFIRERNAVYTPDILIVMDPTLFEVINVTEGLKKGGTVIINSSHEEPSHFKIKNAKVFTIDVTKIALEILKVNIVNTGILGAFSAFTEMVNKNSITDAVKEYFPKELAEKNAILVEKTYGKAIDLKR